MALFICRVISLAGLTLSASSRTTKFSPIVTADVLTLPGLRRRRQPFAHAAEVRIRAAGLQMKKNSIFAYENTVSTYAILF
jgi:hypothetical protein